MNKIKQFKVTESVVLLFILFITVVANYRSTKYHLNTVNCFKDIEFWTFKK